MYKYEMHCHTSEVSKCAHVTAEEQVAFYKAIGYDGIVVTNHFLPGCVHDPESSWREKVDSYLVGYRLAREAGERIGLDVLFGWEYTDPACPGTDLLTYGLPPEWLYDHPEILRMPLSKYAKYIRECGAYVVHAHPLRQQSYIDMIRLLPDRVDAVEVLNASMPDVFNDRAERYAAEYSLPRSCGSDNHMGERVRRIAAFKIAERARDIFDLIDAIKNGSAEFELSIINE